MTQDPAEPLGCIFLDIDFNVSNYSAEGLPASVTGERNKVRN